jgi:hypothetical protein
VEFYIKKTTTGLGRVRWHFFIKKDNRVYEYETRFLSYNDCKQYFKDYKQVSGLQPEEFWDLYGYRFVPIDNESE